LLLKFGCYLARHMKKSSILGSFSSTGTFNPVLCPHFIRPVRQFRCLSTVRTGSTF
jgi:hypothetical protein